MPKAKKLAGATVSAPCGAFSNTTFSAGENRFNVLFTLHRAAMPVVICAATR
jgi:hypothetical protein